MDNPGSYASLFPLHLFYFAHVFVFLFLFFGFVSIAKQLISTHIYEG